MTAWERIESHYPRLHLVYWRRRLPRGAWLAVSREEEDRRVWRWTLHDPEWCEAHPDPARIARRRSSATGFRSSIAARRAADVAELEQVDA